MTNCAVLVAVALALLVWPVTAFNSLIRSEERPNPVWWVDIDDPAPDFENGNISVAKEPSRNLANKEGESRSRLLFTDVNVWQVSGPPLNSLYPPSNVKDKNPTTQWVSIGGGKGFLKMGFEEPFTPKHMTLKWYTSGSYNSAPAAEYTVQVSRDNIDWITIQSYDCLEQNTCSTDARLKSKRQCFANQVDMLSLATLDYPVMFVLVTMTQLCGNFYYSMQEVEFIRWDYKNFGNDWPVYYPACNSIRQSPIDLPMPADEVLSGELIDLAVEYTEAQTDLILRNLGQSIRLDMPPGKLLSFTAPITSLQRSALYTLQNVHFHWGCDDSRAGCTTSRGSEHTVAGAQYQMEVQLMHWNTKYTSSAEAANYEDGLVGISVLFELGESNDALESLLEDVEAVTRANQWNQTISNVARFVPSNLLPAEKGKYWTYLGSATSPDCFEVNFMKWGKAWGALAVKS
jgi:carbonic anhydrase